ncbi:MAG: efflux RND transporter permease subunit, partial [Mycobacteriaceae bacterium]|nr:efflux RND transporter permease subunit [Mycobacteriaceae bacterium]
MKSLGCERSLQLFAPATWTAHTVSASCDAVYPGLRPTGSWLLHPDGELRGLDPDGEGWRDRDSAEPIDLDGRSLVLAYGSNAATAKLLGREELLTRKDNKSFFFGEPVIALRAAVFGWAAVWCDARREGDKSVVATLTPVPDRVEVHPVFALTGQEGKLFHPLAFTKTFAMIGSTFLAMTLVPVLCSFLVRGPFHREADHFLMRGLLRLYDPLLSSALRWRKTVLGAAAMNIIMTGGAVLATMG